MLSSISWTQYFLFIGGATALWLLYVLGLHMQGRRHHKPKVEANESPPGKRIWSVSEGRLPVADPASSPEDEHSPYMPPLPIERMDYHVPDMDQRPDSTLADYVTLENMAMEISEITATLGIATTEQELLDTLRQAFDKYPSISSPHHRAAITKLVGRCALQDCGITLHVDQIESLWDKTEDSDEQ